MKKTKRNILIVFLIIVIISPNPLLLILYPKYEFGNKALLKVPDKSNNNTSTWKNTFDTYQCGMEERHIIECKMNKDSSGIWIYKFCDTKIFNKTCYCWTLKSILPYDMNKCRTDTHFVEFRTDTIFHYPKNYSYYQDTTVTIYKIKNDSMYISLGYYYETEKPIWGFKYSQPISLKEILKPWWWNLCF